MGFVVYCARVIVTVTRFVLVIRCCYPFCPRHPRVIVTLTVTRFVLVMFASVTVDLVVVVSSRTDMFVVVSSRTELNDDVVAIDDVMSLSALDVAEMKRHVCRCRRCRR